MKNSTYLLFNTLMFSILELSYIYDITTRYVGTEYMFISTVILVSSFFITKTIEDLKWKYLKDIKRQ